MKCCALQHFIQAFTVYQNLNYGFQCIKSEALPGVLGNRGKRAFISGEQWPNLEGNRGTKTILGNREHKKTNFRFLGNRGTSQFISGEQVPPLGGPQEYTSTTTSK